MKWSITPEKGCLGVLVGLLKQPSVSYLGGQDDSIKFDPYTRYRVLTPLSIVGTIRRTTLGLLMENSLYYLNGTVSEKNWFEINLKRLLGRKADLEVEPKDTDRIVLENRS